MNNGSNGNYKKGMNPMIAGITGAIIGAGIAALTTKIMTDKKTKDTIMHAISDVRERIGNTMRMAKEEVQQKKEMVEDKAKK